MSNWTIVRSPVLHRMVDWHLSGACLELEGDLFVDDNPASRDMLTPEKAWRAEVVTYRWDEFSDELKNRLTSPQQLRRTRQDADT